MNESSEVPADGRRIFIREAATDGAPTDADRTLIEEGTISVPTGTALLMLQPPGEPRPRPVVMECPWPPTEAVKIGISLPTRMVDPRTRQPIMAAPVEMQFRRVMVSEPDRVAVYRHHEEAPATESE